MKQLHVLDVTSLRTLLAKHSEVREPIAAGASRFDSAISATSYPGLIRRLLLVVDAGAGTTDFAMFQVVRRREEDTPRFALLRRSVRMCRIAGNAMDELLRPTILNACGIDPRTGAPRSADDFDHIRRDLDSQIRQLKQRLFSEGVVDVVLKPNAAGRIYLAAALGTTEVKKLGADLCGIRDKIVDSLFSERHLLDIQRNNIATDRPFPISVLLTGGSALLPMVKDLAKGKLNIGGAEFQFEEVEQMPEWIARLPRELAESVGAIYPQSAVAIGGSVPLLPVEIDDMENPITPPTPGPRILERTQITGV